LVKGKITQARAFSLTGERVETLIPMGS